MFLALALASQTWTMVVGGDIMLNAVAPSSKTFAGISSWVKSADLATANLEIPLTRSKTSTSRKTPAELKAKKQYILKADPDNGKSIANAGFDLVGIANNHAMDYGVAGFKEMTATLGKNGLEWCGSGLTAKEASAPRVVELESGLKVAFVAFLAFKTDGGLWKCTPATDDSPGIATLKNAKPEPDGNGGESGKYAAVNRMKKLKAIVANARKLADVVVVWLHWGTERKTLPDPFQVQLGRAFVEAGADCVLGAHPHVLQGAEVYAGRPIFYSLGNLISPLPASTALFRLTFEGRKFVKSEILPCQIGSGRVAPVAEKARTGAKASFRKLGRALTTKFKHAKTKPMSPG